MKQTEKPAPLVLAAGGIAPPPITMNEPRRDWQRLAALPPFQMFAAQAAGEQGLPPDAFRFALGFARQEAERIGETGLWQRYADWFAAQGLWQGEAPDGGVA